MIRLQTAPVGRYCTIVVQVKNTIFEKKNLPGGSLDTTNFCLGIMNSPHKPDMNGDTPLMYSCRYGYHEICELLLQHNVNAIYNKNNKGEMIGK